MPSGEGVKVCATLRVHSAPLAPAAIAALQAGLLSLRAARVPPGATQAIQVGPGQRAQPPLAGAVPTVMPEVLASHPKQVQRLPGWSAGANAMGWVEVDGQMVDASTCCAAVLAVNSCR